MEVQITWTDKDGNEHIENYLELMAINNLHAIQKSIEHCLDDYDRSGNQIQKNIEKIEIIGY